MKEEEELHRWIRRCNAESTDTRFRVKEGPYLDLISTDRRNGYAETSGDISPGFGAIAVAVPSPLGGTPLSIGAGARIPHIAQKRDAIIAGLRKAASMIAAKASLGDAHEHHLQMSICTEGDDGPVSGSTLSPH
jgi:DNA-binding IclR family transcriptional regulator